MKKIITVTIISAAFLITISGTNAQMMQGVSSDDHTAREEAEGKVVWEKLQAKQKTCADLSGEDFGALGEYFMGQMMGDSHTVMNAMMTQMMGEEGEEQMHVVMGKRLSGCDTSAVMPMMQMLAPSGVEGMTVNWGPGSWLVSLLWLVWLIVGILAAVWLWKQIIKK